MQSPCQTETPLVLKNFLQGWQVCKCLKCCLNPSKCMGCLKLCVECKCRFLSLVLKNTCTLSLCVCAVLVLKVSVVLKSFWRVYVCVLSGLRSMPSTAVTPPPHQTRSALRGGRAKACPVHATGDKHTHAGMHACTHTWARTRAHTHTHTHTRI